MTALQKKRRPRQAIDYDLAVMRLLNQYHYLTPRQLAQTGLVSSERSARKILARNIGGKRAPIERVRYPVSDVHGRLPDVYYLTRYGANEIICALRLDPEHVYYPKGKPPCLDDYRHRCMTIDFQIALDSFATSHDCEVPFFHTYFDFNGANRSKAGADNPALRRRALSKIPLGHHYLIPDANFLLLSPHKKRHLFTCEIYRGQDTKRVLSQLLKHVYLLSKNTIAAQYGHPDLPWRVLCVFEATQAMLAVARRFAKEPLAGACINHFAFSTLELLRKDFANNWMSFDGERMRIVEC